MEKGYLSALRFAERFGVQQYNLGLAEQVEDDIRPLQGRLVERLIGPTPIGHDSVVVDVGAGIGGASLQIARRFGPYVTVAVELCHANLRYAAQLKRAGNGASTGNGNGGGNGISESGKVPVTLVQADAQVLPLATASADVIFNLESAFHYPDKASFIRECRRVLKPAGTLLIGDLVEERGVPWPLNRSQAAHFWTEGRYRDVLAENGLEVMSSEDVTAFVVNSINSVLRHVRQGRWRDRLACWQCLSGVWGAGLMLRKKRLRYLLLRSRA